MAGQQPTRNRWAALLEEHLDPLQVHRLIAESVAAREADLMRDPSLLGVGPDSLAARPPDSSRPSPLGRGALKDFSHCSSRCSSCASSPQPDTARSPTKLFGPAILSPEFSVMEKLAEAQAGAEDTQGGEQTPEPEEPEETEVGLYSNAASEHSDWTC